LAKYLWLERAHVEAFFGHVADLLDQCLHDEAEEMAGGDQMLQRRIEVEHERTRGEFRKALGRILLIERSAQ